MPLVEVIYDMSIQNPCERLKPLIEQYTGWDVSIMLAISESESGCQNRRGDNHLTFNNGRHGMSCGVFQIRVLPERDVTCETLADPFFNVEWAYKLYSQKNRYTDWSDYKNGKYLRFLPKYVTNKE